MNKQSDYYCIISLIKQKWGHALNAKFSFDWKKQIIIKLKSLLSHIKMVKEILTFGILEFTAIRLLFLKKEVENEKVLVSNKIFFGGKLC